MRMCLLFSYVITACTVLAVPIKDLQAETGVKLHNEITRIAASNMYLLYTRLNPTVSQTLVMDDLNSITNSNYNGRLPTVVVVHGWFSKHDSAYAPTLINVFLAKGDVNVIVLDWRQVASGTYKSASQGVPAVGRGLGEFMAFLNRVAGAQFNTFHFVGIGLGAHLVGVTGRQLGGRAARITALDPAGATWTSNPERITPNDAIYVEAIHTDGGIGGFGIGSAVADADFFPNGGNSQPGCSTSLCNHNRAWELFASTVTNNHLVGRKCTTALQLYWDTCRGTRLNMGNDILTKFGTGTYRLSTGRAYPF